MKRENDFAGWMRFAGEFANEVLKLRDLAAVEAMIETAAREMGFRHYAMIHHDDHRQKKPGLIFMQNYPEGYAERYVADNLYREDPVVHMCHVVETSFSWAAMIEERKLSAQHRKFFERGARNGVHDGITVPSYVLGERGGSCNFSGPSDPARVHDLVIPVSTIGSFAFQTCRRIVLGGRLRDVRAAKLTPRERECIILAGQGKSNADIGTILGLSAATVKFYVERACKRYDVHNRTQLAFAAAVDGEIGVHEVNAPRFRWLAE